MTLKISNLNCSQISQGQRVKSYLGETGDPCMSMKNSMAPNVPEHNQRQQRTNDVCHANAVLYNDFWEMIVWYIWIRCEDWV